jgi:hypothetical protein
MPNTYCVQCGAVNQIGDNDCAGCGSYLATQPTYAAPVAPSDWTVAAPHEWQPFQNPHQPLPDIHSFTVGHVLSLTLRLLATHLWLITKIVFLVVTPFEIFKAMTLLHAPRDWQTFSITTLLGLMCNVLIAPALVYALMKTLETGAAPGVNESFRWGLTKIGRLAVCAAISGALELVGYALCVIPGIIVRLTLALVYPVAILERGSLGEVFSRSGELTRGYRWEIFGAEIVLWLLTLIVTVPANFLAQNLGSVPLMVFAAIVAHITQQAFTVLSLMMYLTLLQTPRPGISMLNLTN